MPEKVTHEFALIESLLFERGYQRLERHLARLEEAADQLGFSFSEARLLHLLEGQALQLAGNERDRFKVRLLLEQDGLAWVSAERLPEQPASARVKIAADAVDSGESLRRFKTTSRELFDRYGAELQRHSLYDVLFLNEREQLTEASRSNVFLQIAGELLTPPLSAGVLPGVYRAWVLEQDARARESELGLADLERAEAVYLCNSVRGWQQVEVLPGRLNLH